MLMAIEEHGGGKQLIRLRAWPRIAPMALGIIVLLMVLLTSAVLDQAFVAVLLLGSVTLGFGLALLKDCGIATASYLQAIQEIQREAG
jgi:hypothetical protein